MAEGWTLYTLSAMVIGARVFTQLRLTRQFGIGDIVMIGALVSNGLRIPVDPWLTQRKIFGLLQLTMQTLAFTHGWGRHFFFLSDDQRVNAMEMVFVSEPLGM